MAVEKDGTTLNNKCPIPSKAIKRTVSVNKERFNKLAHMELKINPNPRAAYKIPTPNSPISKISRAYTLTRTLSIPLASGMVTAIKKKVIRAADDPSCFLDIDKGALPILFLTKGRLTFAMINADNKNVIPLIINEVDSPK